MDISLLIEIDISQSDFSLNFFVCFCEMFTIGLLENYKNEKEKKNQIRMRNNKSLKSIFC